MGLDILFTISALLILTESFPSHTICTRKQQYRSTPFSAKADAEADDEVSFYLPIFPTRKSVTLPTGELSLNLFEPRYLSLFNDGVLPQVNGSTFGAIHSASSSYEHVMIPSADPDNLPDICVPKVPVNAIGTLCETITHTTSMSRDGKRAMLRVKGRGVDRFRVEEVVSNGYDYYFGRGGRKQKPYIVCRCSIYCDEEPASLHDEIKIKQTEISLYKSIKEKEEIVDSMWECTEEESVDEVRMRRSGAKTYCVEILSN
jgi:Lon protease-like protein